MEDTSAVFLLDTLLMDALEQHCTDIHLICTDDELQVKFRLAGQLVPHLASRQSAASLLRRVKALAGMDLALQRTPQDGTFRWFASTEQVDVRVSVVPIPKGDSVVLRILTQHHFEGGLTALGMTRAQVNRLRAIAASGSGLVLVAGPTGSGKTTTLYTWLQELSARGRCVVSIEDPVEVAMSEFVQLAVHERIGLDFASGIRALLRQDPDVIMVGEIRDEDTAHTVLNAALTGHLVVTTTHASNLVDALARLSEFGLSRSLLADVFRAVIVQRQSPTYNTSVICAQVPAIPFSRRAEVTFDLYEMTPDLHRLLTSDLPWTLIRMHLSGMSELPELAESQFGR